MPNFDLTSLFERVYTASVERLGQDIPILMATQMIGFYRPGYPVDSMDLELVKFNGLIRNSFFFQEVLGLSAKGASTEREHGD